MHDYNMWALHKDEIIDAVFLYHCFFPDHVIKKRTKCPNKYAYDNCNNRKMKEVKDHHILQFLVYYYMGVVCLLAKRALLKQGRVQPVHPVMWGMIRDMSEFIFKHFPVSNDACDRPDDADTDGNDNDNNNMTMTITMMVDMFMLERKRKRTRVMPIMPMMTLMVTFIHQKNFGKTLLMMQIPMLKWKRKTMPKGLLQL